MLHEMRFRPLRANRCVVFASLGLGSLSAEVTKPEADFHQDKVITKISFGACNEPRKGESPMYSAILRHQPDVFLFLGDNIYGDTKDMKVLQAKYDQLGAQPGFQKLRDETTLLATWDDHDYGENDGGKSYSMRDASQRIFLDFFRDPEDSPRRKRQGVYFSHTFGEKGKRCQLIVLDTRFFRDELPRVKDKPKKGTVGWYTATKDKSKTLLGDTQWKWFEEQLKVPADLRIVCSSIQILAFEKGMENWGHVPHEQTRLFALLEKHGAYQTIGISGDVHFAELSRKRIGAGYFYDLTSSGMSHTSAGWAKAINRFRVGESYPVKNAGLIEINWEAKALELSIINEKAEKILRKPLKFSELMLPEENK